MWSCKGKGDESSGSLSGHLNHRSSLKFNCMLCNFMCRRVDSWLQLRAGAPVFWPRQDSAKWLLLRPFFPTWHITVVIVFVSSSSHICLNWHKGSVNHSQQAIYAQDCFTHSNGGFLSFVYIVVFAFHQRITGGHRTTVTYLRRLIFEELSKNESGEIIKTCWNNDFNWEKPICLLIKCWKWKPLVIFLCFARAPQMTTFAKSHAIRFQLQFHHLLKKRSATSVVLKSHTSTLKLSLVERSQPVLAFHKWSLLSKKTTWRSKKRRL